MAKIYVIGNASISLWIPKGAAEGLVLARGWVQIKDKEQVKVVSATLDSTPKGGTSMSALDTFLSIPEEGQNSVWQVDVSITEGRTEGKGPQYRIVNLLKILPNHPPITPEFKPRVSKYDLDYAGFSLTTEEDITTLYGVYEGEKVPCWEFTLGGGAHTPEVFFHNLWQKGELWVEGENGRKTRGCQPYSMHLFKAYRNLPAKQKEKTFDSILNTWQALWKENTGGHIAFPISAKELQILKVSALLEDVPEAKPKSASLPAATVATKPASAALPSAKLPTATTVPTAKLPTASIGVKLTPVVAVEKEVEAKPTNDIPVPGDKKFPKKISNRELKAWCEERGYKIPKDKNEKKGRPEWNEKTLEQLTSKVSA